MDTDINEIRKLVNDDHNCCKYSLKSRENVLIEYSTNSSNYRKQWIKVYGQDVKSSDKIHIVFIVNDTVTYQCDLTFIDNCFASIIDIDKLKFTCTTSEVRYGTVHDLTEHYKVEVAIVVNGHWLIDDWNGTSNFLLEPRRFS